MAQDPFASLVLRSLNFGRERATVSNRDEIPSPKWHLMPTKGLARMQCETVNYPLSILVVRDCQHFSVTADPHSLRSFGDWKRSHLGQRVRVPYTDQTRLTG